MAIKTVLCTANTVFGDLIIHFSFDSEEEFHKIVDHLKMLEERNGKDAE